MEVFNFVPVKVRPVAGLKSRARGKAKFFREVDIWTNRVLTVLKAMGTRGSVGSKVWSLDAQDWEETGVSSEDAQEEVKGVWEEVRRFCDMRPADAPSGVAALRRQQGANSSSSPEGKKSKEKLMPNRGEIWPGGDIESIALPPKGTKAKLVTELSSTVKEQFDGWKAKMLKSEGELKEIRETWEAPYSDPELMKSITQLVKKMAQAGMLRRIKKKDCEVGMFTVVKKVVGDKITLRLIFDQRSGNQLWKDPKWIGLGGPSAMSNLEAMDEDGNVAEGVEFIAGDLPDCFYRLGIDEEMSSYFAIPEVTFDLVKEALLKEGDMDTLRELEASSQGDYLGLQVVPMGWSWSVWIAQTCMVDQMLEARLPSGEPVLRKEEMLIEGAPVPELTRERPFFGYAYIDDYGVGKMKFKGYEGPKMEEIKEAIKKVLNKNGFPVHKEEEGERILALGHDFGITVEAAAAKRWLALECLWYLAGRGSATGKQVESVVSLGTWIVMVRRCCLSVLEETYRFIREKREVKGEVKLGEAVRNELAAFGLLMMLSTQDLRMPWDCQVHMMDASEEGGGIVATTSQHQEIRKEAKWGIRGGWLKRVKDQRFLNFEKGDVHELETEMIEVQVPRDIFIRSRRMIYLFSGHRRQGDLEWFMLRKCGMKGIKLWMECLDLGYGDRYNLEKREVIEHYKEEARRRRLHASMKSPPCSSWSRARWVPGGPPPLRTRDRPWGKEGLSKREQEHVKLHNKLMEHTLEIMEEVVRGGGKSALEHPADPKKQPYASIFDTARMKSLVAILNLLVVTFPQCMWGAITKKMTSIVGNMVRLAELEVPCCHHSHAGIIGLGEDGHFKTRQLQSYPPELCEKLADIFTDELDQMDWDVEEEVEDDEEIEDSWEAKMEGEKVRAPEMGCNWDPLSRWRLVKKWVWTQEEHNNVLEARASLSSLVARKTPCGRRLLEFTDSQVVLGVFSKGRSSVKILNFLARKVAGLLLLKRWKVIWRYVRTHRNHADGPSRGFKVGPAPDTAAKAVKEEGARGSWAVLPEWFFRETRG